MQYRSRRLRGRQSCFSFWHAHLSHGASVTHTRHSWLCLYPVFAKKSFRFPIRPALRWLAHHQETTMRINIALSASAIVSLAACLAAGYAGTAVAQTSSPTPASTPVYACITNGVNVGWQITPCTSPSGIPAATSRFTASFNSNGSRRRPSNLVSADAFSSGGYYTVDFSKSFPGVPICLATTQPSTSATQTIAQITAVYPYGLDVVIEKV
jgi:hypothetical protein